MLNIFTLLQARHDKMLGSILLTVTRKMGKQRSLTCIYVNHRFCSVVLAFVHSAIPPFSAAFSGEEW